MRLQVSRTKNAASLYVVKSIAHGKRRTSIVVERLGTEADLRKRLGGRDPYEWAAAYVAELNRQEEEATREVLVKYSPVEPISKGEQRLYNGGYLFLQKIYHELGLHKLCKKIAAQQKITYDLNAVLSRLVYGRVIFPASKLATLELSKRFIEQPNFDLQHVYRTLELLNAHLDEIQSGIYRSSVKHYQRNTKVLYYDCTNFFFEIEQEDGSKQYGPSKQHKPNPIIQMGLFMDGNGIPLAFHIQPGARNEQLTLKPLEKTILDDFKLSRFVVCTDAGLSSAENRAFNDLEDRAFITVQSIKKLRQAQREWCLEPQGWKSPSKEGRYDLGNLDIHLDRENLYYKEMWMEDKGVRQRLIVSYSVKYREYQRQIRKGQIERALKAVAADSGKLKKYGPNDFRRFVVKTHSTREGEIADREQLGMNAELITKEEAFDGFYAVCTNLTGDVADILEVNKRRWEIEECFRIMKSEFLARPIYLRREERIKAHFITCFIALVIYRLLETKLNSAFTCSEIVRGLRDMNFTPIKGEGYIPAYTRNDFTDALHDAFGFRTDLQIVNTQTMKKIQQATKS